MMTHYSKCLLVAFAIILPGFSLTPCHAQDEGQFLRAGLLGYTGNIEEGAMLLTPAGTGQVAGGPANGAPPAARSHPDWSINFRLGSFGYHDEEHPVVVHTPDVDSELFGNVVVYGISVTKNISDYFSVRGSLDNVWLALGSRSHGTEYDDIPGNEPPGGWTADDVLSHTHFHTTPLKITVLVHPGAGVVLDNSSGYFNPYLGLGLEFNFTESKHTYNENHDPFVPGGLDYSNSDTAVGYHFLAGIEYVFSDSSHLANFHLGVEFSYNSSNVEYIVGPNPNDTARWDIGGMSILINAGFHF